MLQGCRKDKASEDIPEISIQLPTLSADFQYFDTIPISATVKSKSEIQLIRIQISDENNLSLLQKIELTHQGTSKEISTQIIHNNLHLKSGEYYVRVFVKNKNSEHSAFRKIHLSEAPTELKHIYILRSANNSLSLDTLASNETSAIYNLPFSFSCGAVSSRLGTLLINSKNTLYLFDTENLHEKSSFFHNGSDIVRAVYDPHSLSYFSITDDGYLFSTDRHGIHSIFHYLPLQRIKDLLVTENYIFLIVENFSYTSKSLLVVRKDTRSLLQSTLIDFDLKRLVYSGNENLIIAVGNQNNEGIIKYYNRSTNFFNEVYTSYNHSPIYDAWPASEGRFIISQEDGLISYAHNLNMLSQGIALKPTKLIYENISGLIYAINENGVYILNTNATSQFSFIPKNNCRDLFLLYNK